MSKEPWAKNLVRDVSANISALKATKSTEGSKYAITISARKVMKMSLSSEKLFQFKNFKRFQSEFKLGNHLVSYCTHLILYLFLQINLSNTLFNGTKFQNNKIYPVERLAYLVYFTKVQSGHISFLFLLV